MSSFFVADGDAASWPEDAAHEPETPATGQPPVSPLTGAIPIQPAQPPPPPFVSPLTGASAILPETPHVPAPSRPAEPPHDRKAHRQKAQRRPKTPQDRPTGPLRVRALGAATVEVGGTTLTAADWGYAKPRELLFLLITSPPLTREQLRAALWPQAAPQRVGHALSTALREARRALGDHDWVIYAAGHYAVNRERAFDCDVDVFESALAAASRTRSASAGRADAGSADADQPGAELADLRRAIAAYGGDFLAGMSTGEWARTRRDELRRRFETALLATGRIHKEAGNFQAAVTAFRRAIEHEPLNESAHRELMTCWAQQGEPARAAAHYGELTALLAQRAGVPPALETTALYERLCGRQ